LNFKVSKLENLFFEGVGTHRRKTGKSAAGAKLKQKIKVHCRGPNGGLPTDLTFSSPVNFFSTAGIATALHCRVPQDSRTQPQNRIRLLMEFLIERPHTGKGKCNFHISLALARSSCLSRFCFVRCFLVLQQRLALLILFSLHCFPHKHKHARESHVASALSTLLATLGEKSQDI